MYANDVVLKCCHQFVFDPSWHHVLGFNIHGEVGVSEMFGKFSMKIPCTLTSTNYSTV